MLLSPKRNRQWARSFTLTVTGDPGVPYHTDKSVDGSYSLLLVMMLNLTVLWPLRRGGKLVLQLWHLLAAVLRNPR